MNSAAATLIAVLALAEGIPAPQNTRGIPLEAADCSRVNMRFGEEAVGRTVQYTTVPLSVGLLDVRPDGNGGVSVERGAGTSYAITACIGAGGPSPAEAVRAAESIRLTVEGGRVRLVDAAGVRNWSAHLIVDAPEHARIHVETSNGPIGVTGVSGDISTHSANGPIGLDNVAGRVVARAQNGPISVQGGRGDVSVATDNGPISVALSGTRWDGRLDARAQNGPLTIQVPEAYRSGVEIIASESSVWSCYIAACGSGARSLTDRSRTLRLGSDPVVVRIATDNGPVTVQGR
jgi:hypothetical protein